MTLSFSDIIGYSAANSFGWSQSQVTNSNRIALSSSSEPQRIPGGGIKITVNPLDNPISSTGERSEVLGMFGIPVMGIGKDENGQSGTQFYGISLWMPSSWPFPDSWCIPFQLHGPDNAPSNVGGPAFQIDVGAFNPGHMTVRQIGGNYTNLARTNTDIGAIAYNTWIDLVFQVTWAIDNTGYVAYWKRVGVPGAFAGGKNGNLVKGGQWNAPTLQADRGVAQQHYWKRGCYRSAGSFTTQFYAGPVSRATTFAEAALASFGAAT